MYIRCVSITNKKNGGLQEIISPAGIDYEILVVLNFIPDESWKRHFRHEWIKKTISNLRPVKLISNELRLELNRKDDIQRYIDIVEKLVQTVSEYSNVQEHTCLIPMDGNKIFWLKNEEMHSRLPRPKSYDI